MVIFFLNLYIFVWIQQFRGPPLNRLKDGFGYKTIQRWTPKLAYYKEPSYILNRLIRNRLIKKFQFTVFCHSEWFQKPRPANISAVVCVLDSFWEFVSVLILSLYREVGLSGSAVDYHGNLFIGQEWQILGDTFNLHQSLAKFSRRQTCDSFHI